MRFFRFLWGWWGGMPSVPITGARIMPAIDATAVALPPINATAITMEAPI